MTSKWFSTNYTQPALTSIREAMFRQTPRKLSGQELDEAFDELRKILFEMVKMGEIPESVAEAVLSIVQEKYFALKVERSFKRILNLHFEPG